MYEILREFVLVSAESLTVAAKGLFYPALFFFLLGLAVKRRRLFTDAYRAASEARLNLQIMVFNIVLVLPLITVLSQIMSEFVTSNGLQIVSAETWSGLPVILVIPIAVFIGDFTGYWRHRLEHTRFLWPAHAVHHSDEEMTWLALERFHPINWVTTFVIDSSVLLLMGFPPFAVVANNLVRHYYGYLIHADLPWTYGPLGKVLVSPAMHRWHHAADVKAYNTNYATVFSIFDQAFGTFRVPGLCTVPLGTTDDMGKSLGSQLSYALSPRAYRRRSKKKSANAESRRDGA